MSRVYDKTAKKMPAWKLTQDKDGRVVIPLEYGEWKLCRLKGVQ